MNVAPFRASSVGTAPALPSFMGVSRYRDLFTWQLANAFKIEVHRLLEANAACLRRWKYRDQLLESASAVPKDIAEGFVRYSPSQFARFLDYGLASLAEAEEWLIDGLERKYWTVEEGREALALAKRSWNAMLRLKQSQEREILRRRQARTSRSGRRRRRAKRDKDDKQQEGG